MGPVVPEAKKIKKLTFLKELCLGKIARQNLIPPPKSSTVLGSVFVQKRGTFVQNIQIDSETLVFF